MGRPRVYVPIGSRHGRLTVLSSFSGQHKSVYFECRCDCGKVVTVRSGDLRHRKHPTMSCGCQKRDVLAVASWKTTHGTAKLRIYRTWFGMWNRCVNQKFKSYGSYGGRGIYVCHEWRSVETFIAWAIEHGYEEHLTIDRIDSDLPYEPANCRWVTMDENRKHQKGPNRPVIGPSPLPVTVIGGIAMSHAH